MERLGSSQVRVRINEMLVTTGQRGWGTIQVSLINLEIKGLRASGCKSLCKPDLQWS